MQWHLGFTPGFHPTYRGFDKCATSSTCPSRIQITGSASATGTCPWNVALANMLTVSFAVQLCCVCYSWHMGVPMTMVFIIWGCVCVQNRESANACAQIRRDSLFRGHGLLRHWGAGQRLGSQMRQREPQADAAPVGACPATLPLRDQLQRSVDPSPLLRFSPDSQHLLEPV